MNIIYKKSKFIGGMMRKAEVSLSVGLIGFSLVGLFLILTNTTEIKNTTSIDVVAKQTEVEQEFLNANTSSPESILLSAEPRVEIELSKETKEELAIFAVTAYTSGYESTQKKKGDPLYGITASGERAVEGLTVSADWRVLPKGTRVYIEGIGERVVQDKGGAIKGNKLDVYFESLKDAKAFGKQKLAVTILERGD
jgi:3D (Asp-Asp-Asp) domain-containing protein